MENLEQNNLNNNIDKASTEQPLADFNTRLARRNRKIYRIAIIFIAVVMVAALGVIKGRKQLNNISNDTVANDIGANQLDINWANYPDYARLRDMKKLELVRDFISWTPNSGLENDKIKNINISQQGNLSEAYLYARVTVDNKKLTKYDSFYLKMNNQGGHLFRASSLAAPDSAFSELLFPLEKVDYLPNVPYDENRQPSQINWLNYFQDKARINVYTFISSWRQGEILELGIYYDCQIDSDCSLATSNP